MSRARSDDRLRNAGLLAGRAVLGSYLAAHGAQKLFGTFGGPGLDATASGFSGLGLTPGRPMATLAGASELAGGVLTAAGIADPLGPVAIAGAMTVAVTVHRNRGPLAANGGYELALTNLALAVVLGLTGTGRYRLGPRLGPRSTVVVCVGSGVLGAWSVAKLLRTRPQNSAVTETAAVAARPETA